MSYLSSTCCTYCTGTGPAHRTAHTTTTTSIDMVPKTAATGARQHHPPAIVTGGEFTSLPVYHVVRSKIDVSVCQWWRNSHGLTLCGSKIHSVTSIQVHLERLRASRGISGHLGSSQGISGRGGDFAKNWWSFCEAIICAFYVHLLCIYAALSAHFCVPRRMHRMQRATRAAYG